MELPTCPACGQSVLDDDAQECPFCGADMKGTPGRATSPRKPPPKATAKPRPAAAGAAREAPEPTVAAAPAPATAGKAAPSRGGVKKESTGSDDPFAVDQSEFAQATLASAKMGAGRTLKVVCPMCETTGFIPPQAAGQMVKCCNPECLVPVFSAPATVVKTAEPPPRPAANKGMLLLWGGLGLVVVIGGGIFAYLTLGTTPPPPTTGPPVSPVVPSPAITTTAPDPFGTDQLLNPVKPPPKPIDKPADPGTASSPDVLRPLLLSELIDAARKAPQGRKPYCRRLAALAYASLGDVPHLDEQLEQLRKVASPTGHDLILPLVERGWIELRSGSADAAKATASTAVQCAAQLPPRGRYAASARIELAALLLATGQPAIAQDVLDKGERDATVDNFSAAWVAVQAQHHHDLDAPLPARTFGAWIAPRAVGVTIDLCARGYPQVALEWARSQAPAARVESMMAWAEDALRRAPADDKQAVDRLGSELSSLDPVEQARTFAHVASVAAAQKQRDRASSLVQHAASALGAPTAPSPVRLGTAKEVTQMKLPDSGPFRDQSRAWAERAVAEARLEQRADALRSLQQALSLLSASAPTLAAAQHRVEELDRSPADQVRKQLTQELRLANDDQARRAYTDYKQKCKQLQASATERLDLERDLLAAVANAGLADEVWKLARERDAATDSNDRQPYLQTSLVERVANIHAAAGRADQEQAVLSSIEKRAGRRDTLTAVEQVERLVNRGELDKAMTELKAAAGRSDDLDEWWLRFACRLTNRGEVAAALQWVTSPLLSEILQGDGLELVSARAARLGKAQDVVRVASGKLSQPAQVAAYGAGLVRGLAPPASPSGDGR